LLLAALFGYTAREIGAIEQIPLGTAKTRIRAAMRKLGRDTPGRDDERRRGGMR
jgi:RNA polymerase sigma-70 factor (ECF subfamily)